MILASDFGTKHAICLVTFVFCEYLCKIFHLATTLPTYLPKELL
jgi:hypothetical protein